MKNSNAIFSFLLFVTSFSTHSFAQSKFDCVIGGDNTNPRVMAADSLKNRSAIPKKYKEMTVEKLLSMKVTNKADQHQAVAVKGYIMDIKDGGKESCNCHSTTFKDTHIYLVNDASVNDASKAIIVEATPRMRKALGTTKQLKTKYLNQEVTVYGYLFCDAEHKQNSTADAGKGNHWRGTVWEVHPITKIVLASK
jgi:hypothetical protein